MRYIIRQTCFYDLEILDKIHTENMRGYVEIHYLWNPNLFKKNFVSQDFQTIEFDKQIIGFLKIVTSKTDIYLGEIQITRKFQNLGIGTSIIRNIIKEAQVNQKHLWLRVIKGNPAEDLYKRLGFSPFSVGLTHTKLGIEY